MSQRIPLTRGKYTIVDDSDFDVLSRFEWYCTAKGYAARRKSVKDGGKIILMHRELLAPPDGLQVDHINRDKLDNRRSNLRLATPNQNRANETVRRSSLTGYKGVSWNNRLRKYVAQIHSNGRGTYLGSFASPHDAATAYNRAAKQRFGEFACLNEVRA